MRSKTASFLHALGLLTLPSIEKRIAVKSFDLAKQKAMGMAINDSSLVGSLVNKLEKDIDFVDSLAPGWRKSLNQLLMKEGPGLVAYTPVEHGRSLGRAINTATQGLGNDTKMFISNLTSMDPSKAQPAIKRLKEISDSVQKIKKNALSGFLGASGAIGTYAIGKKLLSSDSTDSPKDESVLES